MTEYFKDKRVLVTGGAGFLGSHVVDRLVGRGASVTVLDTFATGCASNLREAMKSGRVRVFNVDVRDAKRVKWHVDRCEFVFHLASHMEIRKAVASPREDIDTNFGGSSNVIHACLEADKTPLVFASSCAVYGDRMSGYVHEGYACPNNPYGAAKFAAESLGLAYRRCYDLPFTALRYFSLYGPRQRQTVLVDFLRRLHKNPEILIIKGTGDVTRSFIHVDDAAEVTLRLAANRETAGKVFNVAVSPSVGHTIRSVAEELLRVLGLSGHTKLRLDGKQTWLGDMGYLVPSTAKLREWLGDYKFTRFHDGLPSLIDWLDTHELRGLKELCKRADAGENTNEQ